ncbi:Nucleotide-binding, alpha-beta plait [Moelleriella libera RCEF 2490]|uniref:Nucleotide-binding, alpha-beta plait n=1 Tax=Moelleriella libera RCEF 2490 TaxID=1081109 RepID=A0A167XET5_9HYPO|nr:Nucleotide-binding, alpha-beta plait [Moelleriella libera RCEF 2490]
MAQNRHWEQDKEATIYIGNIDERASPSTVYEIMLQMGPIHNIHMPRDRVTQNHQGFGFVEFRTPNDAEYAANVVNGVKLYGKSLRVNKASADKQKGADIGAELFVGNLDSMVDEKLLYDTFSRFGPLLSLPKVARDDAGASKGFGFVSYGDFDSSDAAVANLDGQYLLSRDISVQYAFKKDGKGERHGDKAERELAKQAKERNIVPEAQPLPAFVQQQQQQQQQPPQQPQHQSQGHQSQHHNHHHHQPPVMQQHPPPLNPPPAFDRAPPPVMPPAGFPGAVPVAVAAPPHPPHPPHHHHHHAQRGPPAAPPSFAARGANALPLPPPPASGLPARPPPQSQGYTNPADFHPGAFRPPSGSPNPPGFPLAPPPGFPAAAPATSPAPPGAPAPPPGFMPPPGFQHPPPGFGRR